MRTEDLDLIAAIYDATIDPLLWDGTVELIRRSLGFHNAVLAVNSFDGVVSLASTANIPAPYLATIHRYGEAAMGLWGGPAGVAAVPLEQPVVMSQFTTPSSWEGNAYFEEWAKPQGLVDQAVIKLEADATQISSFSLGIHRTMGPMSKRQLQSMLTLAPHLRRAAIFTGMLAGQRATIDALDATLAAIRPAAFVVDPEMSVLVSNDRGQEMLASGDLMSLDGTRISISGELVAGGIQQAVRRAAEDSPELANGSGQPVRARDNSPYLVHILPLLRRPGSRGAAACLFVTEAAQALNLPLETMQLLYRLTPAETRILGLLLEHRTGPQIAAQLSIAHSTVKTHSLHIFEKVGVTNQVELINTALVLVPTLKL